MSSLNSRAPHKPAGWPELPGRPPRSTSGGVFPPGLPQFLDAPGVAPFLRRRLGLLAQCRLDDLGHRPRQQELLLMDRGAQDAVMIPQRPLVRPPRFEP